MPRPKGVPVAKQGRPGPLPLHYLIVTLYLLLALLLIALAATNNKDGDWSGVGGGDWNQPAPSIINPNR